MFIGKKRWLRGRDLNPRPLGYEPNELPDCSTPRRGKSDLSSQTISSASDQTSLDCLFAPTHAARQERAAAGSSVSARIVSLYNRFIASLPSFSDVEAAAVRLNGIAHRTPVVTSRSVDERTGATIFFKCENLQRAGAFKFRGAYNAMAQ